MPGRKFKPAQPPGVAGGRRHIPDAVQRRQRARANDTRVQGALGRTREEQDALDALMIEQQAEADRLDAEREIERAAQAIRDQQQKAHERRLAQEKARVEAAKKRELWTLGQARDLIRQGYSIEGTMARTGYAREDLDDVEFDEW